MLVRTNGNSKPISKEEENTLKSRLNLFQNALLMQKCSSSTKEEALRSLIGRGSFLSQMIDVVKGGEELPVANDEVKDFFYLMGDCLQNLKVIEYCQRPDPDGTMRFKIVFEAPAAERNYFVILSKDTTPLFLGISQHLKDDIQLQFTTQNAHMIQ